VEDEMEQGMVLLKEIYSMFSIFAVGFTAGYFGAAFVDIIRDKIKADK
jgi:hypothetical protein